MKPAEEILKTPCGASRTKPAKFSLAPRQEKLLSALWQRMAQLFGHKWSSQEGEVLDERGEFSRNFMFWAHKTRDLTDAQWRRGMDHVEFQVREAARQGDDLWPPSYAAFLGVCEPRPASKMYRNFEPMKLPDKSAQERADAVGRNTLDDLLEMFPNQEAEA